MFHVGCCLRIDICFFIVQIRKKYFIGNLTPRAQSAIACYAWVVGHVLTMYESEETINIRYYYGDMLQVCNLKLFGNIDILCHRVHEEIQS